MQGIVFKKPGDDPQRSKIVRLRRKVGTRIATTGRTWMGPQGGEWVEADQTLESPGWFLIRGPGFGFYGPLLEPASGGGEAQPQGKEEQPIVLYARHPLEYEHRLQLCLRPSQTIRDAKRWLARRVPGLRVQKIEVVRQRINCIDQARIQDEVPLRDAELADGDELDYIYLGDVDKDVWFPAER
uniref:Uncharacterized protein n=2 Tax=Alexandrium monilatum TaxID=311494 RepID=A0A7S4Q983_9DINO